MKTKSLVVLLCILAFALGYFGHPRAVLKNSDVNMYSGGQIANIRLQHCRVIADSTAMDVDIHGCEVIDPADPHALAARQ